MIDFKTLERKDTYMGGVQYIYKADNGYGASIVQGPYTYGGNQGLWELAVLGPDGGICYDTHITDDVLGHLSEQEVNETLEEIAKL